MKRKPLIDRQCGTCRWWENTYRGSRLIAHSMGSCDYPFEWNLVHEALQKGIKGWFAMGKTEGNQCPTWEVRHSLKRSTKSKE